MVETRRPDPALVARLRAAAGSVPGLRLAVLFGSAAAGETRASSDVDIAVLETEADHDDAREDVLMREFALAARRDVDLIRLEHASTMLRWQIATKGVLLLERPTGEFARFRAQAASEYIEYAPAFAYYGEIFRRRLIERGRVT